MSSTNAVLLYEYSVFFGLTERRGCSKNGTTNDAELELLHVSFKVLGFIMNVPNETFLTMQEVLNLFQLLLLQGARYLRLLEAIRLSAHHLQCAHTIDMTLSFRSML